MVTVPSLFPGMVIIAFGFPDPKAMEFPYLVAHPTARKWVITPVIYMGFL
jgi:hypothetical protein